MSQQQTVAQLLFPNRENITTGQLSNLLSIAQTAIQGLTHHWGPLNDESPTNPQIPEGKIALENTLIATCNRLDALLQDSRRWDLDYQIELENEFKKTHKEAHHLREAQRKAAEESLTPHAKYNPSLIRSDITGMWFAVCGDMQTPNRCIFGLGENPNEAIESFDKQFRGEGSPAVKQFIRLTNEKSAMVGVGTVENGGPLSGGEVALGDSKILGPVGAGHEPTHLAVESDKTESRRDSDTGSREKPSPSRIRALALKVRRFFGLGKSRPSV